jgi:hypothetical protein
MISCVPLKRDTLIARIRVAVAAFVSQPASARPLAVFRIGLAAVLLMQAFTLASSILELYGNQGLVQWRIVDGAIAPGVPRLRWLAEGLAPYGVSDAACVRGVFWVYVASLGFLLVGWRTRPAAVAAWLTHVMLNVSGNATIYGVDQFAHIALFYCVWMPVGATASVDRLAGRESGATSTTARVALRVLQIHLCIVYLASGIEKASGIQWWNGEAIWRAMMRPDLGQFDVAWLAYTPWLARVGCWGTLAVELGYALLIWPRRTRMAMGLATVGMHAGIGVAMGLVSFSAVMMVLNVAAFLVSPEPKIESEVCEVSEPISRNGALVVEASNP